MAGGVNNEEVKELKKLISDGFADLKNMIQKVENEHDKTRESVVKYERDLYHYHNRHVEFERQYQIDKEHIYSNMERDIKKGIKESILSTKVWVVGFMILVISLLVTIANRLDNNNKKEVTHERTEKD